jgi:hypothetical protein
MLTPPQTTLTSQHQRDPASDQHGADQEKVQDVSPMEQASHSRPSGDEYGQFGKAPRARSTGQPVGNVTRLVLYELKPSGRVLVKSVDDQYDVDEELDLQRAKSAVEVALPRPISTIGSTSKL